MIPIRRMSIVPIVLLVMLFLAIEAATVYDNEGIPLLWSIITFKNGKNLNPDAVIILTEGQDANNNMMNGAAVSCELSKSSPVSPVGKTNETIPLPNPPDTGNNKNHPVPEFSTIAIPGIFLLILVLIIYFVRSRVM